MAGPYRLRLVPRSRPDDPPARGSTTPAAPVDDLAGAPVETSPGSSAFPLVRVGRQAIFDADRQLYGYELLFRADGSDVADLHTPRERDVATSQVLSAALGDFGAAAIGEGLPVFINLTRSFIVGDLPLVVGPQSVVLEVTEEVEVDDEVLAGLARLRADGYRLALDDFEGEPGRVPALAHVDVVKLVLGDGEGAREDLAALVATVREAAPTALVVVERVTDDDDFAYCRSLGVDLFQGFGLERPVVLTTRAMDASQATALRLVAALADAEVTAAEIERLVVSDAGLSLKVLRAASSSAAAPTAPIASVRQAIVMLGPKALAAWTTLVVLGSDYTSAQRQSALTFVLARAGACARLASEDPHVAHTVGLLSGMADALGVPVDDVVGRVRLSDAVTGALHRYEGPAGQALAAVLMTEEGPVRQAGAAGAGMPPTQREGAALAYLTALGEAMAMSATVGA